MDEQKLDKIIELLEQSAVSKDKEFKDISKNLFYKFLGALILVIVAGIIAFVRLPYENKDTGDNNKTAIKKLVREHNAHIKSINDNFSSIQPHLPDKTFIIKLDGIKEEELFN